MDGHFGAYKLVDGLHGWVGFGLHGLKNSSAPFLFENITELEVEMTVLTH